MGKSTQRVPLPPPEYGASSFTSSKPSHSTSFKPSVPSVPSYPVESTSVSSAPPAPAPSTTYDNQVRISVELSRWIK